MSAKQDCPAQLGIVPGFSKTVEQQKSGPSF
jgi:hypothetical protein